MAKNRGEMDGGERAGYLQIFVYLYMCTYLIIYVFQLNVLQFCYLCHSAHLCAISPGFTKLCRLPLNFKMPTGETEIWISNIVSLLTIQEIKTKGLRLAERNVICSLPS